MGRSGLRNNSGRHLFAGTGRRLWRTKAFFIERKEQEARRPRLEVKILPVEPIPEWGFPKDRNIIQGKHQSLNVVVRNGSVTNLAAQFWFNFQGPNYLIWRKPSEITEPPLMTLHPGVGQEVSPGKLTIKLYNQKVNITKEDTYPIMVWFAWRIRDKRDTVIFNIDPTVGFDYTGLPPDSKVYLRIKFIADQDIVEGDEHHYLMRIGGWEKLDLTEIKIVPDSKDYPKIPTEPNPESPDHAPRFG